MASPTTSPPSSARTNPAAACNQVFGVVAGYEASVRNFAAVSLATDGVFSADSAAHELATVTGDVTNGFAATGAARRRVQKNAEPTQVAQVLTALAYSLYIQTTRPFAGSEAMPL